MKVTGENKLIVCDTTAGLINSEQFKKLGEICEEFGLVARSLENQRIGLFVPDDVDIKDKLEEAGFRLAEYGDSFIESCIGSRCDDHEQDALKDAMTLEAAIEQSCLSVGINGCAECCLPCQTFDVVFVGDSSGYQVSIGGKGSQIPELASYAGENLSGDELPRVITALSEAYLKHKEDDERFHDVIERVGITEFQELITPSEVISEEEDDVLDEEIAIEDPLPEEEAAVEEDQPVSEEISEEPAEESVSGEDFLEELTAHDAEEQVETEIPLESSSEEDLEDIEVKSEATSLEDEITMSEEPQDEVVENTAAEDKTDSEEVDLSEDQTTQEENDLEEAISANIEEQKELVEQTKDENLEERDSVLELLGKPSGVFQSLSSMSAEGDSVVFEFESGAKLELNKEKLASYGGRREIDIDGEKLIVEMDEYGNATIEVDGVHLNFAVQGAA